MCDGGVSVAEDVVRDLNEVTTSSPPFHSSERRAHLGVGQAETALYHIADFIDQPRVAVLDAIVDHLREVPGAILADPVAARTDFVYTKQTGHPVSGVTR